MSYTHLTVNDRYVINHNRLAGKTLREIGEKLGRSPGTISRELSRNAGNDPGSYVDYEAQRKADARRAAHKPHYKLCQGPLLNEVRHGLLSHHSPEEIAGRLKLMHPDDPSMHVTHETIYLWIYRQEDARWCQLLRKRHKRRSPRKRFGASKQGQIIGRIGIEHRPAAVAKRHRVGHWESDSINGEPGTGGIATHVERVSRFVVAAKIDDKTAAHFASRTLEAFRKIGIPQASCLTMTADNGKEFAEFMKLEKGLGMKVFFANPHSPWERGTNENTNGLIREYFPKGMDFRNVSKAQVDNMVKNMNNRPRKCLGYQTPREVFEKLAGVALQI